MTTPETIAVRPAMQGEEPLRVRKPIGGHLAPQGESVPRDSYWLRRLADGDVEPVDLAQAKADKATASGKK